MCWQKWCAGDSLVGSAAELLPASKKELEKQVDAQAARIDTFEKTEASDEQAISNLRATVNSLVSALVRSSQLLKYVLPMHGCRQSVS